MPDELYRDVRWAHALELPVMGVPTTFLADSAAVMGVVRDTYGAWSQLAPDPQAISSPSATVRLVQTRDRAPADPTVFRYRVPDPSRMMIVGPGGEGVAD